MRTSWSMRRILDTKYENADLNKVIEKQFQYLKDSKIFENTLVTWKTTPVYLELKVDTKPVCSWPYPEPRVHEGMFKKEVGRVVKLGVLEHANNSKWVGPSFAQPKANKNRVIFWSDFRNLNRQLKCKPYPMPKISEMLLKLEGFKYDTSLELSMVFYPISFSE